MNVNDSSFTWVLMVAGVVLVAFMLFLAYKSDIARADAENECFAMGKLAAKLAVSDEWICVEIKQER